MNLRIPKLFEHFNEMKMHQLWTFVPSEIGESGVCHLGSGIEKMMPKRFNQLAMFVEITPQICGCKR